MSAGLRPGLDQCLGQALGCSIFISTLTQRNWSDKGLGMLPARVWDTASCLGHLKQVHYSESSISDHLRMRRNELHFNTPDWKRYLFLLEKNKRTNIINIAMTIFPRFHQKI